MLLDIAELDHNVPVVSRSSCCRIFSSSASQMLFDSYRLLTSNTTKPYEERHVQHDKHDSRPDRRSSKRQVVSDFQHSNALLDDP